MAAHPHDRIARAWHSIFVIRMQRLNTLRPPTRSECREALKQIRTFGSRCSDLPELTLSDPQYDNIRSSGRCARQAMPASHVNNTIDCITLALHAFVNCSCCGVVKPARLYFDISIALHARGRGRARPDGHGTLHQHVM